MQSLGNLAWTKAKSGQFKVAIQMLNGLLSSQEEYYGKDSREYCETLGLLGHLYYEKEDYEPALKYLTSCRDSLEKLGMAKTHIAVSAISEMIRKVENKLQSNSVWI
jgi:tetratricopeptide (TPR) repeat protein